ncbi:hypothetical protein BX600DRAFT_435636 [Xylariales sp. PMI_506]|nr:hypothetical protein BX600DRAFT_435636 [Xylariales sp. PMI_506]
MTTTITPTPTLLGALTTTFTPPTTCNVNVYDILATDEDCVAGTSVVACAYFQLGDQASTSACLPSAWEPSTLAYFSPGVCPDGYQTACSSVVTSDGTAETQATCCPTGYLCQTNEGFGWYSTDLCYWPIPSTVTFVYTSTQIGVGASTITATGGGQAAINAYGVDIRWKAADFASSTTTTSSATTASAQTSGSAGTGTATSTGGGASTASADGQSSGASSPSTSSGLSTGAQAGIGVGAAIIAIAAIIAGIVFYRRRKARSGPHEAPANNLHNPEYPPGYDAQHGGMYGQQHQLQPGQQVHEFYSPHVPQVKELPANQPIYEM